MKLLIWNLGKVLCKNEIICETVNNIKMDFTIIEAAVYHAIQCESDECIKFSIENITDYLNDKQFDPTSRNYYLLRLACYYGCIEIIKLFLQDLRVNPKREKGIGWTVEEDYQEVVSLDLENGTTAVFVVTNEDYINIIYPDYTKEIHEEIKEKYLRWKYRIGGEKWRQAKNDFII